MTETTTETLYCYVHPTRETSLRCNNCDRPICAACAVRTPTGYRCRECVKRQQKVFDTSDGRTMFWVLLSLQLFPGLQHFLSPS